MGTGSHAPLHLSPGPLARLQLDTLQPYESPLRFCSILNSPPSVYLSSVRSHLAMRRDSHIIAEICELEASFTTQEQAVAKIASMFPTVEESHIRDLYKKYHGSQAVVMSALQVGPLKCNARLSLFRPGGKTPPLHSWSCRGLHSSAISSRNPTRCRPGDILE